MAQEEFLARGRASLARARRIGEFYAVDQVLADMRARLQARMTERHEGEARRKDGSL